MDFLQKPAKPTEPTEDKTPPDKQHPGDSESESNQGGDKLLTKTGTERQRAISVRYSAAIGERICQLIEDNKSLREIVETEGLPSGLSTVFRWLEKYPEFRKRYRRAKKNQADITYEDIMGLEKKLIAGDLDPNIGRVVVDSMKWRASKMQPSRYGDKQRITVDVETVEDKLRKIRDRRQEAIDVTPGGLKVVSGENT